MDAGRLRQRKVTRAGIFFLALVSLPFAGRRADAAGAFFDYLYIEASSGSSAGGHAAVRFGENVYHFQHGDPGIIRPALDAWATFDLAYRGIENRPIHVQRIRVSSDTYENSRSGFHRRYVVQESQVRLLEALRHEHALLECLAVSERSRPVPCPVPLAGAGYFFASAQDSFEASEPSPAPPSVTAGADAIADARRDAEQVYGAGNLERRLDALRRQIGELRPSAPELRLPRPGTVSVPPVLFADEYQNRLLEFLALRVLTGQAPARARAFRVVPVALTSLQIASLRRREARTRKTTVALLRSSRRDRGYPLLVALARLVAFRTSAENGKLVVLDTYADDVPTVSLGSVKQLPQLHEIQSERWQEAWNALDSALTANADDEASWSNFEAAANVALELDEALAYDRPLRAHQSSLAPARGAQTQAEWPKPGPPIEIAEVDLAKRREARFERRLLELYRYDVIRRNCVTEIFRTIDDIDGAQAELGGRVAVTGNVNFIPFVSAAAVRDSYHVSQHFVLPSYRQQELRELHAAGSWRAILREETSLTSTLVPFGVGDEAFLFFSSDSVLLRPLLGAANVVFGSGALLAGAFAAPFDRGALLAAGGRGVLFSLPELAFVNIRKGTVPLLPASWNTASPR